MTGYRQCSQRAWGQPDNAGTGDENSASLEDRVPPRLGGLNSQSLQGKALEMLRRQEAMWMGDLGKVTVTEYLIDLHLERVLVDRRHTGPDIAHVPRSGQR